MSSLEQIQDGFELQFGTKHVGHFLLSGLIAHAHLKGSPGRIVALSSRRHQLSTVDFEDINFEKREYNKWVSYGQSKTANACLNPRSFQPIWLAT